MSREGLSMRKVREILRLRLSVGLSAAKVAKSCKVGKTTVLDYEKRFRQAGLSWPLPADVDDSFLERVVRTRLDGGKPRRDMSDTAYLISEMRKPHVTLHLLWLEYRESHPDGYGYTQFCHYYNSAKARVDLVLRQEHKAGEKLFTDYAGDTLKLTNPKSQQKRNNQNIGHIHFILHLPITHTRCGHPILVPIAQLTCFSVSGHARPTGDKPLSRRWRSRRARGVIIRPTASVCYLAVSLTITMSCFLSGNDTIPPFTSSGAFSSALTAEHPPGKPRAFRSTLRFTRSSFSA